MTSPLETIQPVIRHARHVSVDQKKLETLARNLEQTIGTGSHWTSGCPVDINTLSSEQELGFLFVFNAISFSYWNDPGQPTWAVEYQGKPLSRGTWSMIAALHRAIEEGIPLSDPRYLAEIRDEEFGHIVRGNTTIPLLEERAAILREIGRVVRGKYSHRFSEVRKAAKGDALRLVDLLVGEFPSFEDTAEYEGHTVQFRKRAQLLASDISRVAGSLRNDDHLTACADYILPMVLRYHDVLKYSPQLGAKVDQGIELQRGSPEEVEIRAQTIAAVEAMKKIMGNSRTAMQINDALWLAGDQVPATEQYHRTRTTAY